MAESLDIPITAKSMLKFAFPTIIAQVFMGIYGVADGLIVANFVDTDALSAVNIFLPLLMIVMAVATMLGTGGKALVAAQLGASEELTARQNFTAITIVAFVASAILAILGLIFLNPLLFVLGCNEQLLPLCQAYAVPVLIFIPLAILGMELSGFFIAEGKPELGSALLVIGGVINIVLDLLFIGLWGMGIAGAAWASVAGYCFGAIASIAFFVANKKGNIFFVRPVFRMQAIIKMCTNGISEMIMMCSGSIVTIVLNNIMIRLAGSDGVAAITIILYAESILATIYFGYNMGVSPLASFNFGKNDTDNLKAFFRINMIITVIACVGTFILAIIVAQPIIACFARPGTNVFELANSGFFIVALSFIFMGINDFASSFFTALNDGKTSGIISVMRTLVISLATLIIFPIFWGITGVWASMPAAEVLSLAISGYFLYTKRSVYHYA